MLSRNMISFSQINQKNFHTISNKTQMQLIIAIRIIMMHPIILYIFYKLSFMVNIQKLQFIGILYIFTMYGLIFCCCRYIYVIALYQNGWKCNKAPCWEKWMNWGPYSFSIWCFMQLSEEKINRTLDKEKEKSRG